MRREKTKSKKYVLIILILLLLGLVVGYAAFSDTLTVSGNAKVKGDFGVYFADCMISEHAGDIGTTAEISDDGTTIDIETELGYPGAGVQFDVIIENGGSIPAKVKGLKTTSVNTEGDEYVTITGLTAPAGHGETLEPYVGQCEYSFTVEWPADATEVVPPSGHTCHFQVEVEYEQDTETFTGEATSDHINGGN